MISYKITTSPNLKRFLSKKWVDDRASELIDATSFSLMENIMEYGQGVARYGSKDNFTQPIPGGGAPIWQGKIYESGHYRGYLRESHYVVKDNFYHARIMTTADFFEGVIEGYSTNWEGVTFGANNYPKRAIDKLSSEGRVQTIWKNSVG